MSWISQRVTEKVCDRWVGIDLNRAHDEKHIYWSYRSERDHKYSTSGSFLR